MRRFIILAASWGGTGFSPKASGTVGTLGAIPLYLLLYRLPILSYIFTVIAFTFFAVWVSDRAESVFQEKDSGKIVIDEVAGFLVTMTAISPSVSTIIAGFILFRFFDIVKVAPAHTIDRTMKNGYGVVLDDIVAGIYACLSLHLLVKLW